MSFVIRTEDCKLGFLLF